MSGEKYITIKLTGLFWLGIAYKHTYQTLSRPYDYMYYIKGKWLLVHHNTSFSHESC
jgi:hypothetical protein